MPKAIALFMLASMFTLALTTSAVGQVPQIDVHLMSKAELDAFLDKVGYEVPQWRATLKAIDIASLHVGYDRGKNYEKVIGWCLEKVDGVERAKSAMKKNTLSGELMLSQDLSSLIMFATTLQNMLSSFDSPTGRLTHGVVEIIEQAGPIRNQLYGHFLTLTTFVDAVIDVSDPYAPQIRSEEERARALGLSKDESKKVVPKER